jgi:hypothetical protein
MENKQFKDFVQSVAEIKDLSPKKDPNIRLDADAEETVRRGNEWVELTAKSNPTLGFKFIKLKEQHRLCELGCGDIVANQVVEKRMAFTPKPHWRTRCQNCGCYLSPDGEGFIEGGHKAAAAFTRFHNQTKEADEVPTDNARRESVQFDFATGKEYIEIVTNNSIIRKYK